MWKYKENVEDLLEKDPLLCAIAAQLSTEFEPCFNEMDDPGRVLYFLCANIDSLKKDPSHWGDCTNIPASCTRCHTEDDYIDAENHISKFTEILTLENDEKINDEDELHDRKYCGLLLLSVLLSTAYLWDDWNKALTNWMQENDLEKKKELDKILNVSPPEDLTYRYRIYKNLPTREKKMWREKAELFKNYVIERPIVPGIPWW